MSTIFPFAFVPTFSWPANPGGLLYTYAAGTTNPQVTYSDALGAVPNPNPVVLDANGSATVRRDPSLAYHMVLKDPTGTTTLWDQDNYQGDPPIYPVLGTESGVTAAQWPYGDARRFGSDPTGAVDSAAAINAALACNTRVYVCGGSYKCAAPIVMASGQTLYGDGSATVLNYASGSMNCISMTALTNSTVRDLKLVSTGAVGTTVGGVYLLNCTACNVERVEMSGMPGGGVFIDCSNGCVIRDNYFHNFQAGGNFGDVMVYCASSPTNGAVNNIITGNRCFGGANAFGISLEDPDTSTSTSGFPRHNLIQGNRVGAHATYGILVYMSGSGASPPGAGNTYNQIIGNWVDGILGGNFGNTDSGAGIYVVGKSVGGTQIIGNVIFNCCVNTSTRSLAPAGIGVSLVPFGVVRPVISGNSIDGMSQGEGILVTSSIGGAVVTGNSINMPSTNLGTGAGGAPLLGGGIRIEASSNVSVADNQVQVYGAGAGLYIYANGVNATDIVVSGGGYITNGVGNALQVTQAGGFSATRLGVTGANFQTTTAAIDAISLSTATVVTLTGVTANAASGRALFVNGSTNLRVAGGHYASTGTVSIGTSGTCTNGFINNDVDWGNTTGATASNMSNAGTGVNVSANFSSVPSAGTWRLGDRAINISVTSGNAKAWARVTSGSGNVLTTDWISEGNL